MDPTYRVGPRSEALPHSDGRPLSRFGLCFQETLFLVYGISTYRRSLILGMFTLVWSHHATSRYRNPDSSGSDKSPLTQAKHSIAGPIMFCPGASEDKTEYSLAFAQCNIPKSLQLHLFTLFQQLNCPLCQPKSLLFAFSQAAFYLHPQSSNHTILNSQ